jgi:inosose dehydratase
VKVANAPCSWGVLEFGIEGKVAGYAQVLDEMQQTGYVGTELGDWNFLPGEPAKLKKELQIRGLSLIAAFVPVAFAVPGRHEEGEAIALRTARLLADVAGDEPFIVLADDNGKVNHRTKYAGRIQPEHGLSPAQWQVFVGGIHCIAQAIRKQIGLRSVFHHHCAGYVETPAEIEILMRMTDPELIGLCFDTGHYRFGGGNPVSALKQYANRIWHVHFKDCDPNVVKQSQTRNWDYFESVKHGVFCELGKGDVDFPPIIGELNKQGYDGWIVVEQDVLPGMGSPKESAQRNRDYLKNIGL